MEVCHDDLQVITKKYDVCVLGSTNVGKSSMIYRFIHDQFMENIEGQDLYTKKYINKQGDCDILTIYDSDFTNDMYMKSMQLSIINASCLIFAYSIDNLTSFLSIDDYYHHINSFRKEMPPIFIIGCKSDLEIQRQVPYEEGAELAIKLRACSFHECSAKENVGIDELFQDVIDVLSDLKVESQQTSQYHEHINGGSTGAFPRTIGDLSRSSSMSFSNNNSLHAMRTDSSVHVKPHSPSQLRQVHSSKSIQLAKGENSVTGSKTGTQLEKILQEHHEGTSTSQTTLAEGDTALAQTNIELRNEQVNTISEKKHKIGNKRGSNRQYSTTGELDHPKNKCCVIT
ncbi:Ras2 protein [Candida orthopsilosis Co 90-125]|uniref:small monomeric GTPase n=1 Tax=Candida orthopsilosis (strain 90-125) TaxID=1136231 RepID=H8X3Q1_CANO9|nr:Ras2 protein [Candida orthopsilosis Co 90-125]CCG25689.1 Ras2 protein [Candida orthopsilosis Co 90-125]